MCGGGGFLGWVEFDRFSSGTISGDGGGQTFYVDSNVVNGMVNDPDFMGETAIPAAAGHYSDHPAPAISNMIQVAFRAAR